MKRIVFLLAVLIPMTSFAQTAFQNDLVQMIKANSEKVIGLAEAIPADDYSWSPAEGVRDVEGVIMHIIGANYFFPTLAGATIPEGIDPRNMANTVKGKDASIEALKASYDFMIKSVLAVPESKLNEEFDFYGTKMTVRGALLVAFGHCEEHMGQLIAYARSNNVTPPWSQSE